MNGYETWTWYCEYTNRHVRTMTYDMNTINSALLLVKTSFSNWQHSWCAKQVIKYDVHRITEIAHHTSYLIYLYIPDTHELNTDKYFTCYWSISVLNDEQHMVKYSRNFSTKIKWEQHMAYCSGKSINKPGLHPTNDISIKFEIRQKCEVLWFKMYSIDHDKILHMSRQCNCRDMRKILLWSVEHVLKYSTPNFDQISNLIEIPLTHWGRVTHICIGNQTIIGSDNGLSLGRRQAIIWTNDGILLIQSLETNFREILSKIHTFSFKKMLLKTSSAKWRPSCLDLNVLTGQGPGVRSKNIHQWESDYMVQ